MCTAARSTPNCWLSLYFSSASSSLPALIIWRHVYIIHNRRDIARTSFQNSSMIECYFRILRRQWGRNPKAVFVSALHLWNNSWTYSRWCKARSGRDTGVTELETHRQSDQSFILPGEIIYALARSRRIKGKLSVQAMGLGYVLVCVSGLDGWNTIDSFQAAIASSNSSAI